MTQNNTLKTRKDPLLMVTLYKINRRNNGSF